MFLLLIFGIQTQSKRSDGVKPRELLKQGREAYFA
jgi:hypothetical protein